MGLPAFCHSSGSFRSIFVLLENADVGLQEAVDVSHQAQLLFRITSSDNGVASIRRRWSGKKDLWPSGVATHLNGDKQRRVLTSTAITPGRGQALCSSPLSALRRSTRAISKKIPSFPTPVIAKSDLALIPKLNP